MRITNSDEASCDYRMVMMRMLVEYFSGRSVDVLDSSDFEVQGDPVQMPDPAAAAAAAAAATPAPRDPRGDLAIAIDVESTHDEHETAAFAARGQVQTGDGRTIDLAVDMAMEREQLDHSELHIRAGAAVKKDPLVLSLDGSAPRLTDDKVAFDIDADGTADRVSFVAPGAAFLALDRNANGTIDDGGELFGAIYTRSAATPFELHGSDRAELGAVRSTGVFLREPGGAGVAQQIDLLA